MANPLIQVPVLDADGVQVVDANGISETTTREMTSAEFADYQALQAAQSAQVATDNANANARTSGITHALSLGFTQSQAEAMFQ